MQSDFLEEDIRGLRVPDLKTTVRSLIATFVHKLRSNFNAKAIE